MPSLRNIRLQLMWQYGDRHYQAKRWTEAAGWYLAASNQIFKNIGQSTISKCCRKAALCHIQLRQFARACSLIRRCPVNEASTHYVIFLSAARQGAPFLFQLSYSLIFEIGLEDEGLIIHLSYHIS
jgi:hypothetical protein